MALARCFPATHEIGQFCTAITGLTVSLLGFATVKTSGCVGWPRVVCGFQMLRNVAERPLEAKHKAGPTQLAASKSSLLIAAALAVLLLPACTNTPQSGGRGVLPPMDVPASPRTVTGANIPKGGGIYKVGRPYQIAGQWYTPAEDPFYDETGVASWYGEDFHGRRTSNGEIYDMYALTAAHRTLPMPSYVYVTNPANQRSVMLRVNDRGPYAHGRIIDLSKSAADALGLTHHGTGEVRVRYAGPAPLNGDDYRERQFLASQPWTRGGGPGYAAPAPVPADRRRFAQNPPPYAEQPTGSGGWSPDAYRASQRSGLGR
jgi:rare lipoprotein A (peptidoglycan hydrolase)